MPGEIASQRVRGLQSPVRRASWLARRSVPHHAIARLSDNSPRLLVRRQNEKRATAARDALAAMIDEAVDEHDPLSRAQDIDVRLDPVAVRGVAGKVRGEAGRHDLARRMGHGARGLAHREIDEGADHPPMHGTATVDVLFRDRHSDDQGGAVALFVQGTDQLVEGTGRFEAGEAGRDIGHCVARRRTRYSALSPPKTGCETSGGRPRIMSAAFSATIKVAASLFADGTCGITDASTTRRLCVPYTLSCGSTTAMRSLGGPILHDPTRW